MRPPGAAATLALLLAVAGGAGAGQAAPTVLGAQALSRHGRLQRLGAHPRVVAPFVSSHGARPAIGSGQQYTINDVGAPPNTTNYGPPGPLGFNNTGQMFGTADKKSKPHSAADCFIYTDGAFIDPSSSTYVYKCSLFSINDANSNNAFEVVGGLQNATDPDEAGIVVNSSKTSRSLSVKQFGATDPRSGIVAVNASGTGYGYTYNNLTGNPPKTYSPSTKRYTVLQAACAVPGALQNGCMQSLSSQTSNNVCPFGGCYINNGGVVLGSGATAASLLGLFTLANGAYNDLPDSFTDSSGNSYYINSGYPPDPQLTNYGLAGTASESGNFNSQFAVVYSFAASGWSVLPVLPANCSTHNVLSFNNSGEVLGFDSNCPNSSPNIYWTWDAANGIAAVNIPSNSYAAVQLLGVNDNGQLLATLQTTAGAYDWGTLNPVGGTSSSARRKDLLKAHHRNAGHQ